MPNGEIVLITDNAGYWRWYIFPEGGHLGYRSKFRDKHYGLHTQMHLVNFFKDLDMKVLKVEFVRWGTAKLDYGVIVLTKIFRRLENMAHPRIKIVASKRSRRARYERELME